MRSTLKQISFNKKKRTPIEKRKPKKGFPWKKILVVFFILCFLSFAAAWVYFMKWVPALENLENGDYFRESSIIYDKDGNEIYNIFKDGKRTYVPYGEISQMILDATVSTEDGSFFENPGIDIFGLTRVAATYVTGGRFGRVGGASTISQQLIKNTLLTNEVSIKRKVQEAFLSYRMNTQYSKEKILEMYLNAISFGYNANGVEQASRTFFGKSAKDVWPLGATILASVINAPTRYSPYMHRDRLMGKLEVYPASDTANRIVLETFAEKELYGDLYREFKTYLSDITVERTSNGANICGIKADYIKADYAGRNSFLPDKNGCQFVGFESLGDFFGNISFSKELTIKGENEKYIIEYTIGRKDFVAKQLLEDNKIDGNTYKMIIYDGIDFEFKRYTENIKYPYFVMYVKEYLETKYSKEMDITSGLRIYTTIDPALQEKAEEVIKKQVESNKKLYNASSAALISMDNVDGRLLAMVWGADYFDTENGWNNNMTLAPRQPGSSFKPFVYAIAMAKNPIGPESPVGDTKTEFWSWKPENYDGKYNGIMMVKNALDYSRNIPAGKMYFLAGQQDEIVNTVTQMGITTLKQEKELSYGWPLALGAGEVKPIELMQAYSVLANNGIKRDLYMIEKIETSEGVVIEEHIPSEGKEVFSPAASYITNKILSDNSARPESTYWRNALSIGNRLVAAKTGTANKPPKKWTTNILPWDLWTAGYTPQITTIVWAGNVDGSAMSPKAESLNSAAPIWKAYMEFALNDLPKAEWTKPKDVYTYNIVKTSGKLATKSTPEDQTISTIMATKLTEYDEGLKELRIDTLCNGLATDDTPPDSLKIVYIPSGKPIIDGYDPEWTSSFFAALKKWKTGTGETLTDESYGDVPCETRPSAAGSVSITVGKVSDTSASVSFIGDRMIQKIKISPEGGEEISKEYTDGAQKNGTETVTIDANKNTTITVTVIDIFGFSYTESKTLPSAWLIPPLELPEGTPSSESAPIITMINPKTDTINLYTWDPFNLRFRARISTAAREIQILIDGVTQHTATSGELFVIPMSSAGLSVGEHTVTITAIDGNFTSTKETFTLNILPR